VTRAALAWLQRHWWQPKPSWPCLALKPLAAWYGWLADWQRARTPAQTLPVPVIVVGNVVVGGAGKTPTTMALVTALQTRGWHPGVVSRGYGRSSDAVMAVAPNPPTNNTALTGDEPQLIAKRTGVPVVVGRDRVACGRHLLQNHPDVNVIVSDDGMQHHALARQGTVVVVDARGFGNGLLLPAGPLRERVRAQPPAQTVVLYNAGAASTVWPGEMARSGLLDVLPLALWHAGQRLDAGPGLEPNLDRLRQAAAASGSLTAAAGMAVPDRFFNLLAQHGLRCDPVPLQDHHDWQRTTVLPGLGPVIVTEKDAVKIDARHPLASRVWVARLDFQLPESVLQTVVGWLTLQTPSRPTGPLDPTTHHHDA
jgi:tetraacyldisaccharide 4'-kinase